MPRFADSGEADQGFNGQVSENLDDELCGKVIRHGSQKRNPINPDSNIEPLPTENEME